MSVMVRIPTILRTYTGGAAEVGVSGSTVAGVIDALEAAYPGIRQRLLDERGGLRRFVNVYVGDEDVRFADGLATPTPDGSLVSLIPAVAGGSGDERALASRWPDQSQYEIREDYGRLFAWSVVTDNLAPVAQLRAQHDAERSRTSQPEGPKSE